MRILITGAAGFIGGSLAKATADEAELTLLDRSPLSSPGPSATVLTGDLEQAGSLLEGRAVDVVYHCAGITAAACEADPEAAYAVNVEGTRALLAWCAGLKRRPRFVFTSTVAVFGSGEPVVTEASRVAPASTYGATKAMAEQLVLDAARRGTVDGVVVRLPVTIVRPGRVGRPGAGYLSDLIRYVAAGRDFEAPLAADRALPAASLQDTIATLRTCAAEPIGAARLRHVGSLAASGRDTLAALARAGVEPRPGQIAFRPDPAIEGLIAGWPERLASLSGSEPEALDRIVARSLAAARG